MPDFKDFQESVNETIGPNFNFVVDEPHAGKPKHVDVTRIIEGLNDGVKNGSDKVEVDFNGDIIGGSTRIGPEKIGW